MLKYDILPQKIKNFLVMLYIYLTLRSLGLKETAFEPNLDPLLLRPASGFHEYKLKKQPCLLEIIMDRYQT